jgi:hypothetical protein
MDFTKTHFDVTRVEERCLKTEFLQSMFCDNNNYLNCVCYY